MGLCRRVTRHHASDLAIEYAPLDPLYFAVVNITKVIVISTDYRDARKAAYQEFVVAPNYNVVKLPRQLSPEQGAALGVAFVTSALALGSCFGLSFSDIMDGPDLRALIHSVNEKRIPEDVQHEALRSIDDHERALEGDWVAIWGGMPS